MEKKKYVAVDFSCNIEVVEIEKESEKSVWVNGRRNAKRSDYENYFDTFEDAKNWLLGIADSKIKSKKFALECAEQFKKNIIDACEANQCK